MTNKLKIFNDPIYGFVNIPDSIIFDLIEHPIFQRLRHIQQMGLSNLVYPGANHSRFHHAVGCLYLMQKAVNTLRTKQVKISKDEEQGLYIAILLHDAGHGPFSHALEGVILENISHESISLALMEKLNIEFNDKLDLAIQIFTNQYHRKFFYQLISSQLDVDRLDYLKRDSFYTGVIEGSINSDRLIAMLQVKNDCLVIEEKGIYSIEKFLLSRRFMYWQVYLHKTALISERILVKILQRAKELLKNGIKLPINQSLGHFINQDFTNQYLSEHDLKHFLNLDDINIWMSLKEWQYHDDLVLSKLSRSIMNRELPKVIISEHPFEKAYLENIKKQVINTSNIDNSNIDYFYFTGQIKHRTYNAKYGPINILMKDGAIKKWLEIDKHFNTPSFKEPVIKHFVSYPKHH